MWSIFLQNTFICCFRHKRVKTAQKIAKILNLGNSSPKNYQNHKQPQDPQKTPNFYPKNPLIFWGACSPASRDSTKNLFSNRIKVYSKLIWDSAFHTISRKNTAFVSRKKHQEALDATTYAIPWQYPMLGHRKAKAVRIDRSHMLLSVVSDNLSRNDMQKQGKGGNP